MSEREVYPNSPLALVAIEVRHPTAAPLSSTQEAEIKRGVASVTPLSKPAHVQTVTITAGLNLGKPDISTQTSPRFMSRDKALSVTFRDDALVVETTRYERYEVLRKLVILALKVRQNVAPVDGIERVGIRYINEVRVPYVETPTNWQDWVQPALSGPTTLKTPAGLDLNSWQGVTLFGDPAQEAALVRHGLHEGYAVNPGGDLRRKTPPPGPFFLIDIDSYWLSTEETPAATPENTLTCLDRLNTSARELFESVITDRLRNEVLRNGI
ncbi:TIGR04255 family protein [Streptomyces subrutilus]|uniref:TIGR04255 family protein n=1 Tax=Streptomyces subrutilus TaxID=36818 RepID=UPI0033EB6E88